MYLSSWRHGPQPATSRSNTGHGASVSRAAATHVAQGRRRRHVVIVRKTPIATMVDEKLFEAVWIAEPTTMMTRTRQPPQRRNSNKKKHDWFKCTWPLIPTFIGILNCFKPMCKDDKPPFSMPPFRNRRMTLVVAMSCRWTMSCPGTATTTIQKKKKNKPFSLLTFVCDLDG